MNVRLRLASIRFGHLSGMALRLQPTLSNISATTKMETVFNSGVECFMCVKLACGADTIQSSLVATHSNQFRIPPRRDPEVIQNQITTAQSNRFHPRRARGNSSGPTPSSKSFVGVCMIALMPVFMRLWEQHELCGGSTHWVTNRINAFSFSLNSC